MSARRASSKHRTVGIVSRETKCDQAREQERLQAIETFRRQDELAAVLDAAADAFDAVIRDVIGQAHGLADANEILRRSRVRLQFRFENQYGRCPESRFGYEPRQDASPIWIGEAPKIGGAA